MSIPRFNPLAGFLIMCLFSGGSLAVAAVAVDPKIKPDGQDLDTWRQIQAARFKALRASIGDLPVTPSALLDDAATRRKPGVGVGLGM
ncbi:hypothetical protein [Thiocapsa sp.]|uniref:hypothetical protein n=1 Tax=Thiocapsa sp. TaxID=2024551 RepID=UPI00359340C3